MITSIVSLQSTLSDSKAGPSGVVELGHISQTTDIGTPIEEDFTRKAALDYVLWLQAILRVLSSAPGNLENSVTKVLRYRRHSPRVINNTWYCHTSPPNFNLVEQTILQCCLPRWGHLPQARATLALAPLPRRAARGLWPMSAVSADALVPLRCLCGPVLLLLCLFLFLPLPPLMHLNLWWRLLRGT